MEFYRSHVLVCGSADRKAQDMESLINEFEIKLKEQGLNNEIKVIKTGSLGLFDMEPVVIVYPEGAYYANVKKADVSEIVSEHLLKGRIVERLLYKKQTQAGPDNLDKLQFYKKQTRIAMKNCGAIDPTSIDEYLAMDGYKALEKAITTMTPSEVIEEVKNSGLRGRGGSGFPTATKWSFAASVDADQKYVICNADEGDLGAFMDRGIIEGDPHSIIEAMIIAGYAIGGTKGYIYCRIEYPLAIERFQLAIKQAQDYGLLGNNIMETGFSFDIELRLGAGAYVCGEETALIASIEGQRGEPRLKPPFPPIKGLNGKPTVLNNVETLSNIPQIILKGADWYSSYGTEKCKGTKVYALGGKIMNTGLVEVPMGTTLREIIYDIGGGIPGGKKLKGVQTSGGFVPVDKIDMPMDFDSMSSIGTMLGSGGLIVMDEDDCMVDMARFLMEFMVEESCGKCTACRIGTTRMLELLEDICEGRGKEEDIDQLYKLAGDVKKASFCGLGQFAPNPVIYTIDHFRNEYEEHINNKKCPAGHCDIN